MKIIFIGSIMFSEAMLKKLISLNCDICGVITKDKHGINADYVNLIEICKAHNIPYWITNDVNSPSTLSWIREKNVDIIFCFGWSQILKKDILTITPMGVIGFHPAHLPQNRGRHPLIWALALGLQQTASTFFGSGKMVSDEV